MPCRMLVAALFALAGGAAAQGAPAAKGASWSGDAVQEASGLLVGEGCQGVLLARPTQLLRRSCTDGALTPASTTARSLLLRGQDGAVYAFGPGAARSTDGGASFTPLPASGLPPQVRFAAVAADGTVYVDGGQALHRLPPGAGAWSAVRSFGDSLNPQGLFVDAGGRLYLSDYFFEVLVSDDGGATFTPSGGEGFAFPTTPTGFVQAADGSVLVGTYFSGVYRSSDRGASWVESSQGLPSGRGVRALRRAGNRLVALVADQMGVAGLYQSSDHGQSWNEESSPLAAWTKNEAVGFGVQEDGTLYLLSRFRGLALRPAGSSSWETTTPPRPHSVTVLAAARGGTLHAMSAGGIGPGDSYGLWARAPGAAWRTDEAQLVDPLFTLQALAIDRDSNLYVATYNDGIYVRERDATGFIRGTPLPNGYTAGALAVTRSGRLIAGQYFEGALVSTDLAASWAPLSAGLPALEGTVAGVAALSARDDVVYALVRDQRQAFGIYRLGGNDVWTALPGAPGPASGVHAVADGRLLVALQPTGASMATQDAGPWTPVSALAGRTVRAFASSHDGRALAAATSSGIYLQASPDAAWQLLPGTGLPSPSALSVSFDAEGYLHAGTAAGVFRYGLPVSLQAAADVRVNLVDVTPPGLPGKAAGAPTRSLRIEVFNAGPQRVPGLRIALPATPGITAYTFTCSATPAACTPAAASDAALQVSFDLEVLATAVIEVDIALAAQAGVLPLTVQSSLPAGITALSNAEERNAATTLFGPTVVFYSSFEGAGPSR